MLAISSYVKNNRFVKNVSTLALGTIISQVILLGSSTILTRLFSPTDFGLLAVFSSVGTIAAILTTGRYELAIGLPESDEDGANMTGLVICSSGAISLLFLIIIIFFKFLDYDFASHNLFFKSSLVYLIPVFTFLAGTFSAFAYWNQRKKNYSRIAVGNTIQVLSGTLLTIIFGFLGYKSFGLIWGSLVGQFGACVVLYLTFHNSNNLKSLSFGKFLIGAKRYIAFPKYMIFSDFLLTTSQQIVPIIFSVLFNSSIVGYFSIANRMLRIPSIVLTSSIGNVFRNDVIDAIRENGNCKALYLSVLKKLVLLSIPIYLFAFFCSPWLFTIFFGKSWVQAGYFAQIICLMLVFDFIALPLNGLFYVLNKQKMYLRLQFSNTVFGIFNIYLGYWIIGSPYAAIFLYALNNAIFSLVAIFLSYNLAKKESLKLISNYN